MVQPKLSRMTYLGGSSGRRGLLAVLAFPVGFSDEQEFTVFYTTAEDRWAQLQFPFDVASVTYLVRPGDNYKGWWLVGKRGEVVEVVGGKPQTNQIPTAGTGVGNKYGYLSRIRSIGDELYICGYRRQVYRRRGPRWDLISEDILDRRAEGPWNGFESIDGFSENDIYAVGDEGEIWHFDGKSWTQSESPTNVNLADVRCIDGRVWICGDGGVVLSGSVSEWTVVHAGKAPSPSWWSVEGFGGEIYLAGDDFLGIIDGQEIRQVQVAGRGSITTQTLHAKEGILWSIGEEDIFAFDGQTWRELTVPENR
jgi:hypothetical protein